MNKKKYFLEKTFPKHNGAEKPKTEGYKRIS